MGAKQQINIKEMYLHCNQLTCEINYHRQQQGRQKINSVQGGRQDHGCWIQCPNSKEKRKFLPTQNVIKLL